MISVMSFGELEPLDLVRYDLWSCGAEGEDDDSDDDEPEPKDPKDRKILKLKDENAKRRLRERELEQQLEAVTSENEELKSTGDSDTAKWRRKYELMEDKFNKLRSTSQVGAIRSAIVGNEQFKWHDVNLVINQLDMDELAVDFEDGSVGGLEDQLSVLAEKRPFLLKNHEQDRVDRQERPTGDAPQTSAAGDRYTEASVREDEMLREFPALQIGRM